MFSFVQFIREIEMFRFQTFDIWQRGSDVVVRSFRLAEFLEKKHMHRFAEQVRSASLSITNNIAEGSGSVSQQEFKSYLNIARRSVFEVANMCLIIQRLGLTSERMLKPLLTELDGLSRMIWKFRRSLPGKPGARSLELRAWS